MSWEYWKAQVNEKQDKHAYTCPECGGNLSWIFLETLASKGEGRAREEIQKYKRECRNCGTTFGPYIGYANEWFG